MHIYTRLLCYIKPYRLKLAIALAFTFAYSVSHSLVSVVSYIIFNGFYHSGEVVFDSLPKIPWLTSEFSFSVTLIPYIVMLVFITRAVFDYVSNYLMSSVGLNAIMDVRNDLFRHLSTLSLDFYNRGRTGDLISRIMGDVQGIQNGITSVLLDLVKQPLILLFNIPLVFFLGRESSCVRRDLISGGGDPHRPTGSTDA